VCLILSTRFFSGLHFVSGDAISSAHVAETFMELAI
jgi:hypothetical protein